MLFNNNLANIYPHVGRLIMHFEQRPLNHKGKKT